MTHTHTTTHTHTHTHKTNKKVATHNTFHLLVNQKDEGTQLSQGS